MDDVIGRYVSVDLESQMMVFMMVSIRCGGMLMG